MTMAARSLAKQEVFKPARVFKKLPDVLIQDPARNCAYYVPATDLATYEAKEDIWGKVGAGTVTFVISSGDFVEDVPPFLQDGEENPSVLIQFPRANSSYFLEHEDLRKFEIPQPEEYWDGFDGISFVIPRGLELIEKLPAMRRAGLQSGT